ncbi:hypothetical protein HYC85_015036 [Camellia sinensis]|uniref:Uncharacterized protein n=1 Tax=Camellia sinensis TaxID=4442 RepID=A0A7J7H881_CAMSI|nr:hypothetical protein HYC85_015036 [Camellia sinensis]
MEDDDNQQFQNPRSNHSSSPDSWISLPSKSSTPKVDDTMLALTIVDSNRALTKPLDPSQHVAADPEGNNYVGDLDRLKETDGISVYNIPQHEHKKRKLEKKEESVENEEEGGGGGGVEVDNLASETWLLKNQKSPWAGKKEGLQVELTEEQKKYAEKYAKKKGEEKSGNSEKGKCMRTYMGHSMAVRDIWFRNDGTKFLTTGYDKNIKYWDTETGQVISAFSTGKIPYVVRLNPDEDKQNILLAGMSDKKVVQWDMNIGQITQDADKSLRVWEFGIPVVIKYISEPHMHSMPAISLHPNTNWLAAQSLDNQILIYSIRERFQLNKKKRFAGHIVAGYACQVNFSPDGSFFTSGDGEEAEAEEGGGGGGGGGNRGGGRRQGAEVTAGLGCDDENRAGLRRRPGWATIGDR